MSYSDEVDARAALDHVLAHAVEAGVGEVVAQAEPVLLVVLRAQVAADEVVAVVDDSRAPECPA